ncbi:MAG: hypothetical protein AAFR16_05885 [Pseudomonadota bacterium]
MPRPGDRHPLSFLHDGLSGLDFPSIGAQARVAILGVVIVAILSAAGCAVIDQGEGLDWSQTDFADALNAPPLELSYRYGAAVVTVSATPPAPELEAEPDLIDQVLAFGALPGVQALGVVGQVISLARILFGFF